MLFRIDHVLLILRHIALQKLAQRPQESRKGVPLNIAHLQLSLGNYIRRSRLLSQQSQLPEVVVAFILKDSFLSRFPAILEILLDLGGNGMPLLDQEQLLAHLALLDDVLAILEGFGPQNV